MLSTVINRVAASMLLIATASASAAGSEQPPRMLHVPVVWLRLPIQGLDVDTFPEQLRARCDQIADNANYTGHAWIFGHAHDAGSDYYVLTGYFERRHPSRERQAFELWENGSVIIVRGGQCGADDALETFDMPDPDAENHDNVPGAILRQLAGDLAARTVRAAGGADKLRAEIKSQRIDFNRLPPDMQQAFAPYFGK